MIKLNVSTATWNEIEKKHEVYLNEFIVKRIEGLYANKKTKTQKLTFRNIKLIEKIFGTNNLNIKVKEICCNSDLKKIKEEFEYCYRSIYKSDFVMDKKSKPIKYKQIKNIINYIFDYDHFSKGKYTLKWNRHEFINKLGVKVCPYCNRNYITTYYDEKDKINKTTADADHYYCQDKYPILALNVHNLVPSCQVCNSRMKGDETGHLYPYEHDSNILYFTTPFSTINELYNYKQEDVKIDVKIKDGLKLDICDCAQKSKKIFKLDSVYQIHNDIVFDIKNRIKDYTVNKDGFENIFQKNYAGTFRNIDEFKLFIFDFLQKDVEKNTLVKLKQDIYNQIMSEIVSL